MLLDIGKTSYQLINDDEIAEFKQKESNFMACSVCSFKVNLSEGITQVLITGILELGTIEK